MTEDIDSTNADNHTGKVIGTAEQHVMDTHEAVSETGSASDQGLFASLGLNAQLFGFQLLNFVIVAVVVWFLILKPLTKTMEQRKKIINDSLENAKEVETKLQMSEQKYQEKIDEAKTDANKIIKDAGEEAGRLKEEMKNKAKSEIEMLITQAKRNIQIEKEEMVDELKKETGELVVRAVEKIIKEKLDSEKDKKIIEDSLKKIHS